MTRGNTEAASFSRQTSPRPVHEYRLYAPDGEYWFSKIRYVPKTFRYGKDGMVCKKPEGADSVLYVAVNSWGGDALGNDTHWAEGEKDADALVTLGGVEGAVSCHQGAGKATLSQARVVAEYAAHGGTVWLWVDKDGETGAHDAVLRHDQLRLAGFTGQIVFLQAFGSSNKDAFDHLQRYPLSRAVHLEERSVRALAESYSPSGRGRYGY